MVRMVRSLADRTFQLWYPLPDEGPVFTVEEGMAEDAPLHEQLAFLARQRSGVRRLSSPAACLTI